MRLIDANKLRKDVLDLPNCYNGFSDTYDKAMIIDLIDEQPTVDAVPTEFHDKCMQIEIEKRFELELKEKHGHWKVEWFDHKEKIVCSVCECFADRMTDYCPNCGAKMDEVDEDAD